MPKVRNYASYLQNHHRFLALFPSNAVQVKTFDQIYDPHLKSIARIPIRFLLYAANVL